MAGELQKTMADRMTYRENLCKQIQNDITTLATKLNKLTDHDLESYQMLINPDALFNDSPISPFWTYHWLTQFMIKKDMDFIGQNFDGKASIKPFLEKAQEASGWVLKFANEKPAAKKGVQAII